MPPFSVRARLRPFFLACALLATLSFGCAATEAGPRSNHAPSQISSQVEPPFYRVEGRGGANLSILGTIHLGPSGGWPLPASIGDALKEADQFILEIDLRSLDEGRVGDLLAAMVILPVGTTLDEVISPETAKLLEEQEAELAAIGFPKNARRHKKPWYLATSLITLGAQESGYDPAEAVESAILQASGSKPMSGLETLEDQLRLLDSFSPEIQDLMLRDTLERRDEAVAEIQLLVDAWRSNDQAALAEIAYQGIDQVPEFGPFYDALLKDRNRKWVHTLSELLEDPAQADEEIFVGVGALHLVGSESVVDLLRRSGYSVRAIHAPRDRAAEENSSR